MGLEIIDLPSPNQDDRPDDVRAIDTLVLHYTGMPTARAALNRMLDPIYKVSGHWCIEEDGTVYRMVPEERRAWHSGVSFWRGRYFVNDTSIGIELVNPGHDHGYRPFPRAQMDALLRLASDILARHPISPLNVVGHSDVAPLRKKDPGELFDWARLAKAGIGRWPEGVSEANAPAMKIHPDEVSEAVRAQQMRLFDLGYGLWQDGHYGEETSAVVRAFQRHFRQARVDGILDRGTAAILDHLLKSAAPR